jgi:hypothetical protein
MKRVTSNDDVVDVDADASVELILRKEPRRLLYVVVVVGEDIPNPNKRG